MILEKTYSKIVFILLLIIYYYFNFLGRNFGVFFNFIATGILNFFLVYYLIRINPFKKIGLLLLFFPFVTLFLTFIYGLVNNLGMPGITNILIYAIALVFVFLVHKSNKKNKLIFSSLYLVIFIISVINHSNILNYYYYNYVEKNFSIVNIDMPSIQKKDFKGKIYEVEKNKIQVIDLWSNSCGQCISQFPKFEKLKNDYKGDEAIEFYALNIIEKPDDQVRAKKFLKGYTFNNYFTDSTVFKKLRFSAVPYYVVVGKDNKIKYFGSLNTDKLETYNNMYDIIENEKK
jgi:thiol-disulfide isomerase/thioredoxin